MTAPQVIVIVVYAIAIVGSGLKHGEPKGRYNIVEAIISTALSWSVLYWGGFWA